MCWRFGHLEKSNIDFALDAFSEIASRPSCAVIALDIKGFFDNLDHRLLKDAWSNLLGAPKLPNDHFNVYRSLTKSCVVDKVRLYQALNISPHNPKKSGKRRICEPDVFRKQVRGGKLLERNNQGKGIPQGSPISALLSNIYMFSFDAAMSAFAMSIGGTYMRYCDGFAAKWSEGRVEGPVSSRRILSAHATSAKVSKYRTKVRYLSS